MFSPRTVFIIGAGASYEIGLPLGVGLRDQIQTLTHSERNQGFTSRDVARAVEHFAGANQSSWSDYFQASQRIQAGLRHVGSIDTFLDIHRENRALVDLGKIAICVAIRQAERASTLFKVFGDDRDRSADSAAQKEYRASWYVPFGQLFTTASLNQINNIFDDVSVVTFNYDRCIEFFAERLIRDTYGVVGERSRRLAEKLEVLHVYGKVGEPYLTDSPQQPTFGHAHESVDFAGLSRGIRTFTETVDSEVGQAIRDRIAHAETLVFLGFGWLRQNLDLLRVENSSARRIFFTTKGVEEADRETVTSDLQRMVDKTSVPGQPPSKEFFRSFEERGGCADLFRGHWRQLTLR